LEKHAMNGGSLAALDAIELVSSGLAEECFTTLAVLAEREIRAQRIMSRDGVDRDYALLRIDAQHPDSYFIEKCNYVLYNNADAESFKDKCRQLFMEVLNNE
jgi:dephospho-CoA kinase